MRTYVYVYYRFGFNAGSTESIEGNYKYIIITTLIVTIAVNSIGYVSSYIFYYT